MISVVVCTANRAASLRRLLEHMATLPTHPAWELVIVDNNSKDGTADVVRACAPGLAVPVRYVAEPRQGLSHARNTALRHVQGDIVAFTDDDCLVATSWLSGIAREFAADPVLAILGGRVEPGEGLDPHIATRRHPERVEIHSCQQVERFMMGANLCLRRSTLDRIGTFDVCLGAGSPCRSGEDIDYVYRALRARCRVFYSPDVTVEHWHDRLDDAALARLQRGYLTGRGALLLKQFLTLDYATIKTVYWDLRGLLRRGANTSSTSRQERLQIAGCLARGAAAWLAGNLKRMTSGWLHTGFRHAGPVTRLAGPPDAK